MPTLHSKSCLESVTREYDPEFDVPADPQVSWVEINLVITLQQLIDEVERLEMTVSHLTDRVNALEAEQNSC